MDTIYLLLLTRCGTDRLRPAEYMACVHPSRAMTDALTWRCLNLVRHVHSRPTWLSHIYGLYTQLECL